MFWPKPGHGMSGFDLTSGQGSAGQDSIPSAPGWGGVGKPLTGPLAEDGTARERGRRNPAAPPGRWRLPRPQPPPHGRND